MSTRFGFPSTPPAPSAAELRPWETVRRGLQQRHRRAGRAERVGVLLVLAAATLAAALVQPHVELGGLISAPAEFGFVHTGQAPHPPVGYTPGGPRSNR